MIDGTCWRCRFFDRDEDDEEECGFCRRFPPAPMEVDGDGEAVLAWPGVGYLDWCGEFEEEQK